MSQLTELSASVTVVDAPIISALEANVSVSQTSGSDYAILIREAMLKNQTQIIVDRNKASRPIDAIASDALARHKAGRSRKLP